MFKKQRKITKKKKKRLRCRKKTDGVEKKKIKNCSNTRRKTLQTLRCVVHVHREKHTRVISVLSASGVGDDKVTAFPRRETLNVYGLHASASGESPMCIEFALIMSNSSLPHRRTLRLRDTANYRLPIYSYA